MTMTDDIREAVGVLRRGGIILYPTDTIWGIGCDATNAKAVERIYEIKHRNDSKALICLIDSDARLQRYARDLSDVAWDLLTLTTTPTTIVLDNICGLAENLYADDGSVGIRISHETFSKNLCHDFEKPIVSTSANLSGMPAPTTFADICEEIVKGVDYVCTTRQDDSQPHKPSAVIRLTASGEVTILRR